MRYVFKYRRRFFWHSLEVAGHNYLKEQDKMVLYLKNGGVREIKNWVNCECQLGTDWFKETKDQMEKQIGTPIKVTP